MSNSYGFINTTIFDSFSQLYGPFGIIGRTIVLYANQDDFDPRINGNFNGNLGPIIACGIIGICDQ